MDFKASFRQIMKHDPYPWQERLYHKMIVGEMPGILDIPTGLGKTCVIPIWLIAISQALSNTDAVRVPRRLLYIVDRRVIVDQASDLLREIKCTTESVVDSDATVLSPYISTFRGGGGVADSRDWMLHPDKPSIVVGTVDMVGSRLFFSGYGLGGRVRPFYAGLMGQDSLIVLDETHLSPALERTLLDMQEIARSAPSKIYPPQVLLMSATSRTRKNQEVLALDDSDLQCEAVCKRYDSEKLLRLVDVGDGDLLDFITKEALKMTGRTIVYVQKPSDATSVAKKLRKEDKKVAVLTGTIRGFERDVLVRGVDSEESDCNKMDNTERLRTNRVCGDNVKAADSGAPQSTESTTQKPTPKAEPASPADIFAMFAEPPADGRKIQCYLVSTSAGEVGADLDADDMVSDISTFDSLIQRLGRVNRSGGRSSNVVVVYSDRTIDKSKLAPHLNASVDLLKRLVSNGSFNANPRNLSAIPDSQQTPDIFSPVPDTQPLMPDIVDMWSMTSLDKFPARPAVHYWLRGHHKYHNPETHVAWRQDVVELARQDKDVIKDVLDAYPVLPHEMARDSATNVKKILEKVPAKHAGLNAIIRQHDGTVRVSQINEIDREDLHYATLLLPCEAGGLDAGMLGRSDKDVSDVADDKQYKDRKRINVDVSIDGVSTLDGRQDGFDGGDYLDEWLAAHPSMKMVRSIVTRYADGANDGVPSKELHYYVAKSDGPRSASSKNQKLDDHHADVKAAAEAIVSNLRLDDNLPDIASAIVTAAEHHDLGKAHRRWQECMHGDANEPLAKIDTRKPPLNMGGFRHEFESMRRLAGVLEHPEKDLTLHLIAAHHGWARPNFRPNASIEASDKEHTLVMKRYASLQKRFGAWGLAWLEGILRGADWQASALHEVDSK